MTNIVLPMAGAGRRFAEAGYTTPKPFIDVMGVPMIERVLENLHFPDARFVLIAQKSHVEEYKDIFDRMSQNYPVQVLTVTKLTEGAACTVLTSARVINNHDPLLIANSDQMLDIQAGDFIRDCQEKGMDGSILTFWANDPKWSFAETNQDGVVTRVVEKEVVSEHATAGLYYFSRGIDFLHAAVDMIVHNDRVNNEFYVAPTYNYAIKEGARVGIYEMDVAAMHGLGTPADLDIYLKQHEQQPAVAH